MKKDEGEFTLPPNLQVYHLTLGMKKDQRVSLHCLQGRLLMMRFGWNKQ